jgi:HEAT repeat protein
MPLFGPPNIEKLREKRDVDGLLKALVHKDAETRRKAAVALGDLGDAQAVEPLIAALKDEDERVRMAAAYALGKLGDSRAVEHLLPALKHRDWFVRQEAAVVLGELGDPRAVRPLVVAIRDEYKERGKFLAKYQSEIERTGGWTPLGGSEGIRRRFDEIKSADVAATAARALAKIGPPAVEPLVASLRATVKSQHGLVRDAVGHILGEVLREIGDSRAVEPLIAALKDKDSDVRGAAAAALDRIGGPEAQRALAEYLARQK